MWPQGLCPARHWFHTSDLVIFSLTWHPIGWKDWWSNALPAQWNISNPKYKDIQCALPVENTRPQFITCTHTLSTMRVRRELRVIIRLCSELTDWTDLVPRDFTILPFQFSRNWLLGVTVRKPHYHTACVSTDGAAKIHMLLSLWFQPDSRCIRRMDRLVRELMVTQKKQ